ncbi:MAG: carbohydrate ABC transporter permease [Lachnospiraceae bacterium]|nr:carbohydrate ABC transporter permease [Lachnospiraceae bacterium]
MKKVTKLILRMILYGFLAVVTLFAVFPVVYILLSSFKSNQEILVGGVRIIPLEWHLENYVQAWNLANFGKLTFNSIFYTVVVVAGCVLTSILAGYVFARGTTRFSQVVNVMLLCSMFVSIGTLSLYPQLSLAKLFGLNGTLWGPIIIRVFGMNATQVFVATGFIRQISKEIDEAAQIDGCSFFGIFCRIIFPLCKPLVATTGLMAFRTAWSDYLLPYVFTISAKEKWPLVVGVVSLKSSGEAVSSWNLMLAGISISILPMFIIYLFLNKYFISGLTEGSVKG